ncbi:hypothetical protein CCR75_003552 [Bremia lactucae]|uniref:Secreted protein n=1 Tax=Bremia lactucae TaxID=4779 RepID=A0A976IHD5_BRELC|nr:hypothetical protein CCR75_003552 [Bremia lactucae]
MRIKYCFLNYLLLVHLSDVAAQTTLQPIDTRIMTYCDLSPILFCVDSWYRVGNKNDLCSGVAQLVIVWVGGSVDSVAGNTQKYLRHSASSRSSQK